MRRTSMVMLVGFLTFASVALLTEAGPAAAGGLVRQVGNEAEFRAALLEADADDTGPHRIVVTADIDLGGGGPLEYSGTQPLTIAGRGHVLRDAQVALVMSYSPALLTVTGLTFTDAAQALRAGGSTVVRNSTFRQIGVSHGLAAAGGVVVVSRSTPGTDLTVMDSRFLGNRAFYRGLLDARRIEVIRSRFVDNITTQGLVAGGTVEVRDSEVLGTRAADQNVLQADWASLTLDHTLVAGTVASPAANATLSAYRGGVVLLGSVIRDNGSSGPGRDGAAVFALRLRSDHSVIRHVRRACWITEDAVWIASVASDRSCRFP